MRICYFADGRYIHAERWMKFFVERGHEMHLISFAAVPPERIDALENLGIKYHGTTGNLHLKRIWLTWKDVRLVRSVLKKERIEILHSHFLGTNTWYAALSRFKPHIITVMGGDVIGNDWKPAGDIRERILTPYALRNADAVTAWSPSLALRVEPYVRRGLVVNVVHGGVNLKTFRPAPKPAYLLEQLGIPKESSIIFSPRLMRSLYNIDKIAHAAGLICDERPDTYFLIALPATILDQEYLSRIEKIFEENSAREKVRFLPTIGHDQMAEYFRLADVVISIPDTDGTPMAVLESMACGTPSVIGELPDYDREYFENEKTTLMVDVKDHVSIAEAILRLLSDKEFATSISGEARARVEKSGGYEYQMSKMEEIYHRVTAR